MQTAVPAMLRVMRDYKLKIKLLQSLDEALNNFLSYGEHFEKYNQKAIENIDELVAVFFDN